MKVSDELKKRIRQLEEEQERQHQELQGLDELRDLATIKELEKELFEINDQIAKSSENKTLEDIELSLDDILKDFELPGDTDDGDVQVNPQSQESVKDIDLSLESPLGNSNKASQNAGKGYSVCLMFNPKAPSEWSDDAGGGWRGRRMGTRYLFQEQAETKLQELQQKWPDNPMQIVWFDA